MARGGRAVAVVGDGDAGKRGSGRVGSATGTDGAVELDVASARSRSKGTIMASTSNNEAQTLPPDQLGSSDYCTRRRDGAATFLFSLPFSGTHAGRAQRVPCWLAWMAILARPEQAGYGHWPLGVPLGSAASGYSSYCLLFSFTAPGLSVALAAAAERGAWVGVGVGVGVWVCLRSSVPRVLGVGGASLSDSTRQDVEDLSILSFPNIFIFFSL